MQEVRHRRATRDRDMVGTGLNKGVRLALVMAVALTAAAADAKKKKVTTPPPPPPPTTMKVYVPYKPYPPEYASPNMAVPPLGADGLRTSVNRGISPAQTLWNFRSAYNVAALSCNGAKYATIVPGYRAFLRANAKVLTGANRTVDAEWRNRYGAGYIKPREKYMTEVYNHFAIPPTLPAFCDAVMAVTKDMKTVKPAALSAFATANMPAIEIVFDDFFKRFDQYRLDMAAWEAKWGPQAVPGSLIEVPIGNSTN